MQQIFQDMLTHTECNPDIPKPHPSYHTLMSKLHSFLQSYTTSHPEDMFRITVTTRMQGIRRTINEHYFYINVFNINQFLHSSDGILDINAKIVNIKSNIHDIPGIRVNKQIYIELLLENNHIIQEPERIPIILYIYADGGEIAYTGKDYYEAHCHHFANSTTFERPDGTGGPYSYYSECTDVLNELGYQTEEASIYDIGSVDNIRELIEDMREKGFDCILAEPSDEYNSPEYIEELKQFIKNNDLPERKYKIMKRLQAKWNKLSFETQCNIKCFTTSTVGFLAFITALLIMEALL